MLDELGPKSVVVGGKVDVEDHYVAPTVLRGECVSVFAFCMYLADAVAIAVAVSRCFYDSRLFTCLLWIVS